MDFQTLPMKEFDPQTDKPVDGREHVLDRTCWCKPEVVKVPDNKHIEVRHK